MAHDEEEREKKEEGSHRMTPTGTKCRKQEEVRVLGKMGSVKEGLAKWIGGRNNGWKD